MASHPINQFPEDMAFSLKRMILWNPKVELTNPDDHFLHLLHPSFLNGRAVPFVAEELQGLPNAF
jgi:hypothetical protein